MAKRPKARHPIQPLERDEQGVIRFKRNAIVDYLAKDRLNEIGAMDFSQEDREQLRQLIGYSHSGIPACSAEVWDAAETIYKAGVSELEARCNHLRDELTALKAAIREPIARLYGVHPDNLLSDDAQ